MSSLIHGDCLNKLQAIPPDSVQLVMTSPPYAQARGHDYGGTAPEDYTEWFLPIAKELQRVLSPRGSFILNIKEGAPGGERSTYVIELILAMRREQGWHWVEEYIWHKTNAVPGKWKTRFRDSWERLIHFTNTMDFDMYQDEVMVPTAESTLRRTNSPTGKDFNRNKSLSGSGLRTGGHGHWVGRTMCYPSNVLVGAPITHNTGHSAAYPEYLPSFFIRLFSKEGDMVLDPFAGSGTTLAAAKKLGRRWTGVEKEWEYVKLAEERLEKTPESLFSHE